MDPDPNSETTPPKTTTTSGEPKGTFQDRVNQLTRRASDAERAASTSVAENAELKAQMSRLETQIASLSSRPAAPASVPGLDITSQPKQSSLDEMAKQITESVLGAVQPVLAKVQEDTANTQLAAKQKTSLDAAVRAHPELNDPASDMYKTLVHLWNSRPDLHTVDGAPELLAEASKGLLSEARANDQVRKLAASAQTPNAARTVDGVDEDTEINDTLKTLTKEGKDEGWSNDDFEDFLKLKFKQFGKTGQ